MKKITLLLLLLFSISSFSQENKIIVTPNTLKFTSLIQISVKKKGEYKIKVIAPDNEKLLLKSFNINDVTKLYGCKFNFGHRIKGDYKFILLDKNDKVVKEIKINKPTN